MLERALIGRLEANRERRVAAVGELDEAREELGRLLTAGRQAGVHLSVMCRQAGITRENGYAALAQPRARLGFRTERT